MNGTEQPAERALGPKRPRGGRSTRVQPALLALSMAVVGIGLSACGGGSGPTGVASLGTTSSPSSGGTTTNHTGKAPTTNVHQDAVRFAKCMRSHGVTDFPDPKGTGGTLNFSVPSGIDPNSAQFKAAQQSCRKYLPARTSAPGQSGPSKAVLIAYAKCIRSHGEHDFPDPVSFPGGAWGFDLVGQVDTTSPAFQKANRACKGHGYGGVKPCGGAGPSGSKERRC
jgi:hypothetical protein